MHRAPHEIFLDRLKPIETTLSPQGMRADILFSFLLAASSPHHRGRSFKEEKASFHSAFHFPDVSSPSCSPPASRRTPPRAGEAPSLLLLQWKTVPFVTSQGGPHFQVTAVASSQGVASTLRLVALFLSPSAAGR